mmetsp:Transcript_53170/g.127148  ORF Transcript_53170/g.127148 Transcript_53170/m.127148 type:complete len:231 (+) Transcript_53170:437-1129(+)
MPRGWVPVRVVVSFLGALQSVPVVGRVALRVLPGGRGATVVADILVGGVETFLALPLLAIQVEVQRLVLAQRSFSRFHCCRRLLFPAGRVVIAPLGAVPQPRVVLLAHVLQHHLAHDVGLVHTAAMLGGPLDVELRSLVEGHSTLHGALFGLIIIPILILTDGITVIANLVSTLRVVLRVKESVLVLRVVLLLTQLVVGATGVVQVHVSQHAHVEQVQPYKAHLSGPRCG